MTFFPEWLLALALTLLVLDMFIATEALTWSAFAVVAGYLTWVLGPSPLWAVLIFLGIFLGLSLLFYCCGVRVITKRIVARYLLRGSPKETIDRIVGQEGVIYKQSDRAFLKWNGELWPIDGAIDHLKDGDRARVVAFREGSVEVNPL